MLPMAIVEFRFPERLPARDALLQALEQQLGAGVAKRFDGIEVQGELVRALSQDPISLMYFAKVCQSLGGKAVARRGNDEGLIPIPAWAEVPWTQHGRLKRLGIRLGRISLAPVLDAKQAGVPPRR
jgi:hypothetical protein